jgi:hypothetical protein
MALAVQQGWQNVGWASDWGKNIYAPSAFLVSLDGPCAVRCVLCWFGEVPS